MKKHVRKDSPSTTDLAPVPKAVGPLEGAWRASDLTDRDDQELAEEFRKYYAISSALRLEAYRRIDAYRLKHEPAAGERWTQAAEGLFDLKESTLYAYSRAWQAFEEAVSDEAMRHFADRLKAMGGGPWQIIGRAARENWLPAAEAALNVVDRYGVGRGLVKETEKQLRGEGLLPSKRKFGPPLNFREFRHEPINEQGVVFLFGMVAKELGFLVEGVASSYPDCIAKRKVKGGLYEPVNIEFEFEASSFRKHKHDAKSCDLLICWENDWPGCPVEVIELKAAIKNLSRD